MIVDSLMMFFVFIITTYYITVNASGLLINLFAKRFHVARDYRNQPIVSVVMSCFNEGESVYNTIKSMRCSNYPVEKLAIYAFDDCSKDDSFLWIQKAAQDFPNVFAKLNKTNQGKAHSVLDAVELSSGEIIVSVDSDCVFEPNAIQELVACFTNPKIAAVGGRVGISNANANWLTRFQTLTYALSFLVLKSSENICRKIQCLSGPLVAIRRDCFNEIKAQIANRSFLGVKITNGEDRALTQMLLFAGYETYLNNDAVCYTSAPEAIGQYAKQQLRWRRSAIGQFFQLVRRLPEMVFNNGLLCSSFSLFPIFVLLIWNLIIISSWFSGAIMSTLMAIVLCHFMVGPCVVLVFYYYAIHSNCFDLKAITLFDLLISRLIGSFWYPVSSVIITLFALFTLDDGGWVTRDNSELNQQQLGAP
jgi:cellulose synthase/poly-beta-1,6-N-acetylglucosamine synthase-like glycosyltransferase